MKLNGKEIIYIDNYFECNNVNLKLIDALKILKDINTLELSYELSKVRHLFNMDILVDDFKQIFNLINK